MKRIDMINIKDIIRQRYDLDLTRDQISAAVGISAGTVSNVLKRARAAGLSYWPLPDDLDDRALHEKLYPSSDCDSTYAQPAWDEIITELKAPRGRRRAKLTQRQVWVEYRDEVEARGGTAYCYLTS